MNPQHGGYSKFKDGLSILKQLKLDEYELTRILEIRSILHSKSSFKDDVGREEKGLLYSK